ncbi:MAG: hypothetical protein ACKVOK_06300 [Flavobacteriales bacterium]
MKQMFSFIALLMFIPFGWYLDVLELDCLIPMVLSVVILIMFPQILKLPDVLNNCVLLLLAFTGGFYIQLFWNLQYLSSILGALVVWLCMQYIGLLKKHQLLNAVLFMTMAFLFWQFLKLYPKEGYLNNLLLASAASNNATIHFHWFVSIVLSTFITRQNTHNLKIEE